MEIRIKSDIYKRLGVSRETFNRRYLPELLKLLKMDLDDWKKLYNRVFEPSLSLQVLRIINNWLQST